MQGHAAANLMPVVASNRIGTETLKSNSSKSLSFYGNSFITDAKGSIIAEASKDRQQVITATFDLDQLEKDRINWGVFRDRRPSAYAVLTTHGHYDN